MTEEQHAEAILVEACCPMGLDDFDPNTRQAILTACAAMFDAGAKAGLDAALIEIAPQENTGHGKHCCCAECAMIEVADIIRAIDPAILRTKGPDHD